jgi:hypothetical protein
VKGIPGAPTRSAGPDEPLDAAWSRPTGKAIVFVPPGARSLEMASLDAPTIREVTPLPSASYLSARYHPSGLALAFAVERGGKQSIWISSNSGRDPTRLVFSEEGTTFGAMDFRSDGRVLFYAAEHADDHPELHMINLTDTRRAPVVWKGRVGEHILNLYASTAPGLVGLTTGSSCAHSTALWTPTRGGETTVALPKERRPTSVVGWLGPTTLLVGIGSCAGPLDLTAVDVRTGTAIPLVFEVDAAASRLPVPAPAPPLAAGIGGSGFA